MWAFGWHTHTFWGGPSNPHSSHPNLSPPHPRCLTFFIAWGSPSLVFEGYCLHLDLLVYVDFLSLYGPRQQICLHTAPPTGKCLGRWGNLWVEVEERKENVGFLLSGIQEPPTLGASSPQPRLNRSLRNPPANAGDPGWIPDPGNPAVKPLHHNYWACALEPRSHKYWSPQEEPLLWEALPPQLESSPPRHSQRTYTATKTQCSQKENFLKEDLVFKKEQSQLGGKKRVLGDQRSQEGQDRFIQTQKQKKMVSNLW